MPRMGVGSRVDVRLYLEGYHIPNALLSTQVAGMIGGPSTCQLSIVPTNTAKHIMPGTWVHVFVTDPWDPDPQGDLSDYKLLFEGVVVGRGFTKESEGRHLMLQCADPSIYWVNARQAWLNLAQSSGGLVNELSFVASSGEGRFGSIGDQPEHGFMLSKLAQTDEERFLDTMISVLDDIGNVNPFYNNQRNRFRITDRILQVPGGKTDQLFTLSLMTDFLNGLAGRTSGQTNLAQLVNTLLAPIYHEWVSVVAPSYLKDANLFSRDVYGNVRKIPVKKKVNGQDVTLNNFERATDDTIGSILFKPQVYTLSPPSCNVLFPNMFDHQSYSENFLVETTRVAMTPQFPLLKDQKNSVLQALHLMRPAELEIFRAITAEDQRRTEDAKFGDGEGQTGRLNDFDWTTNEERVRGIAYNHLNLPPAASALTFADQGATSNDGIIKYLQNVASYEFYKSKFQSRSSSFTGPFNMRPVPGFPLLTLDDSDANMNIVAYLASVTHSIDARGQAQTSYDVKYPRVLGEVDWNRPTFKAGRGTAQSVLEDDEEDEQQQFRFERLFDGVNRPAIPDWFGNNWRTVAGLTDTYQRFFGVNELSGESKPTPVSTVEQVMFEGNASDVIARLRNAKYPPSEEIIERVAESIASGDANVEAGEIDLMEVATVLIDKYNKARTSGREFEEVSRFTARPFTRIDQAFRFVGARPSGIDSDQAVAKQNAKKRELSFTGQAFDRFVGDTAPGAGYAGIPKASGESTASSTRLPQMSGVFSEFDIRSHPVVTEGLRQSEVAKTNVPRYDGRPIPFDFEQRLYNLSRGEAGATAAPKNFLYDDTSDLTREEQIAAAKEQRLSDVTSARNTKSHKPEEQAPTGEGLDTTKKLPLPQPLAEGQVVELRRRVIAAYRDELKQSRGFTG